MTDMREIIKEHLNRDMDRLILSGARCSDGPSKVKIRPVFLRDELMYQVTETIGPKEFHRNLSVGEALDYVEAHLTGEYKQLQLEGREADVSVLVSRKGKQTVKVRKHPVRECKNTLEHNRKKRYILPEGIPVPFLVDLGVMTKEGKIVSSRYDKYRQINRFLEFIEDVLPRLDKERELTILDFGCGKSYLTFAMYYYLCCLKEYQVRIIGLDLKKDVITDCSRLAQKYGYDRLQFLQGDIASYEGVNQVDMVVTLHACDTATDYALAKAVQWNARVILSVPCCQHEVNTQIANDMLEPVLSYGIIKERMSALITDAVRAQLLQEQGYEVQILEFIDMEHTPKNLLIRGIRKCGGQDPTEGEKGSHTGHDSDRLQECMTALHIHPTLAALLEEQEAAVEEDCD